MMKSHYLPMSISNRTAATIQVTHQLSASSTTGYTDIIQAHQTTQTKAIKTDFKLAKLETLITIDLEYPKVIKIQLLKRRARKNRLDHHNASSTTTTTATATTTNDNQEDQQVHQKGLNKSKLAGKKIKKLLLNNSNANRKFLRLNVNYFLNSQPYLIKEDEPLDEQLEDETAEPSQCEPLYEDRPESEAGGNLPSTSNHVTTNKRTIPQFEIFQAISDDGSVSIMILKRRNFSNWMSHLPDNVSISELTIPGSHQSCSLDGWPIAQCQTRSLSRQLQDGIRFLDIRLALPSMGKSTTAKKRGKSKNEEGGQLIVYHGIQPQKIKFEEILKILDDFLTRRPTETVIISIKRENHSDPELFKQTLVNELIAFYHSEDNFHAHWWLKSFLPESLDQVRGKLILFSRDLFHSENDDDFGIRFPIWPNNSSEIWETSIPNTNVAVQDWYGIGSFLSISKKSALACVSLCGALHEPLRSTSSPMPPSFPKSPNATNDLTLVEEESAEGRKENVNTINENESSGEEPSLNETPKTWVITFLSASSLLLGFPTFFSRGIGVGKFGLEIEGINARVARWLVSRRDHQLPQGKNADSNHTSVGSSSIKGVVCLMDFYQSPKESLVSLLVDCNFPS